MQVFIADSRAGVDPQKHGWRHLRPLGALRRRRPYLCVHKYGSVHLVEIKPDFSGYGRVATVRLFRRQPMGKGHHFYKINGKYYISVPTTRHGTYECAGRQDRGALRDGDGECEDDAGHADRIVEQQHRTRVAVAGNDFEFSISGPGDNRMGCARFIREAS
jgi:hypothetical protein